MTNIRRFIVLLLCVALSITGMAAADIYDPNEEYNETNTEKQQTEEQQTIDDSDEETEAAELLNSWLDIIAKPNVSADAVRDCVNSAWDNPNVTDEMMIRLLRAVVSLNRPEFDEERYSYIIMLFAMDDSDTAIALLREIVANDPSDLTTRLDMLQALYEYGTPEETLEAADETVSLFPESSDAWAIRGFALEELYRFDEAVASQREAVEVCKTNGEDATYAYYNLFQTAKRAGDFGVATRAIDKVISEWGNDESYIKRASYRLWSLRDPEAALSDMNALLTRNPALPEARYIRLFALIWMGDTANASIEAESFKDYAPNIADLIMGISLMYEGKLSGAEARLNAYTSENPDDSAGYIYLALLALYENDDTNAAIGYANKALALNPHDPDALRILAAAYASIGNWSLAEDLYAESAEYMTEEPDALEPLAMLLLASGKKDEAKEVMREANCKYPNQYGTLFLSMCVSGAIGDYDKAYEIYQTIVEAFPFMQKECVYYAASNLALAGDEVKARELLLEFPPMNAVDHCDAAQVLILLNDFDAAQAMLDKADELQEAAQSTAAEKRSLKISQLVTMAELVYRQKDYAKSFDYLRQACELGWYPESLRGDVILHPLVSTDEYKKLTAQYPAIVGEER